nr:hypothetical protein [Tanacetum cinerariifolium]
MTRGFGVHGNMGCWGSGIVLFKWVRCTVVAILEKTEHNNDFHQIVDFLEASRIRVETTDAETKILAQVNGRQRTVSKSSIKRHLKLNDEDDETAFPSGDVRYREAFPTDTSLDAGQDRENIAKTSAMPHETLPRVTSLGGGEDRLAQEDASNTGGMDQGEDFSVGDTMKDSDKSTDKGSDSIDEMSHVLGSLRAANILASGGLRLVFTTASPSVATANIDISFVVATASGSFSIAAIFTTASVATPTSRIKEKFIPVWEKMQDFMPMNSKLESERLKRPGIQLDKERCKKLKTTEASDMLKKFNREDLDKLWSLVKKTCSTTEVIDEKAKELRVELKRLYEPNSRDPLWALQRLSVPTADAYIANKLATVEDFALLHEDKIYSESKTHVCYIKNVDCDYSINLREFVRTYFVQDSLAYKSSP